MQPPEPGPPRAPRLIVTRPRAQGEPWVDALRAARVSAEALPLIDIAPVADRAPLEEAWAGLSRCALVMFVSANAVAHFFEGPPRAWPAGTLAGATGPGTRAALVHAGVPPAQVVEPPPGAPADSEGLWRALQPLRAWAGAEVRVVRGEQGREWLADTLAREGAQVRFVAAYRRLAPEPDAAGRALLAQAQAAPAAHWWHFSSSEAIHHLAALAPGASWQASQALATHPRIAQAARALGFGRVVEVEAGVQAAVDALHRLNEALRKA